MSNTRDKDTITMFKEEVEKFPKIYQPDENVLYFMVDSNKGSFTETIKNQPMRN